MIFLCELQHQLELNYSPIIEEHRQLFARHLITFNRCSLSDLWEPELAKYQLNLELQLILLAIEQLLEDNSMQNNYLWNSEKKFEGNLLWFTVQEANCDQLAKKPLIQANPHLQLVLDLEAFRLGFEELWDRLEFVPPKNQNCLFLLPQHQHLNQAKVFHYLEPCLRFKYQ